MQILSVQLISPSNLFHLTMSGCGNPNCNCGTSCSGCSCKRNMDDSMITSGIECDTPGCSCTACSDCAPSCGCVSCSCH